MGIRGTRRSGAIERPAHRALSLWCWMVVVTTLVVQVRPGARSGTACRLPPRCNKLQKPLGEESGWAPPAQRPSVSASPRRVRVP